MEFNNNNIFGFDVSFYQRVEAHDGFPAREVDFNRMKFYGADFVIIKAGQFAYPDPGFNYNWNAAKVAGISRGSYWFEDKDGDPKQQAITYWNLIKNDVGEGICAMDYESGSHNDLDSAYVFMNELQQLSGLPDSKLAIYTGYPYWKNLINNADRNWFKRFNLWQAWYPEIFKLDGNYSPEVISNVLIAPGFDKIQFWQDGTPAIGQTVGVQSRDIDHDLFNGTREEFELFFGKSTGGTMPDITFTGTVKSTVTLGATVRSTPAGTVTGQKLFPGTNVQGVGVLVSAPLNGVNYDWMNIVSPTTGWVATSLLDYSPVNPTSITHKLEVFVDGVLEYTRDF